MKNLDSALKFGKKSKNLNKNWYIPVTAKKIREHEGTHYI